MSDLSAIPRAGIAPGLDLLARPRTPAERAAALLALAESQAAAPTRGPSSDERERLAAACSALARRSSAAEQWNHLADKERRLLAAYAGLRESNPGVPLGTLAARQWHEFSADERAAIGQGTRLLLRRIAALGALMQRWWVVE